MQRYGNGTGRKNLLQIEEDKKKREMDKLLKGKALLPHLGANWGSNTGEAGGGGGMTIVFEPKRAVSLDAAAGPRAGTGSNQGTRSSMNRKRSFKDMESGGFDDKENDSPEMVTLLPPTKRAKTSSPIGVSRIVSTMDSKSEEEAEEEKVGEDNAEEMVSSVMVTVYVCQFSKCALKNKASETLNMFCSGHQGHVTRTRGKKWFWKCGSTECRNTIQTLNTKRVPRKCKCGRSTWEPASAFNAEIKKKRETMAVVDGNANGGAIAVV